MASEMAEAIRQLISEKGIPEELIIKTLEDSILAAYKKKFGTSENAIIRFKENYEGIEIYAKKTIVSDDDFEDEVLEIPLEEARKLAEEAEIGDILEIPVDPSEFDFQSVMLAKQTARQSLRDISRDTLYAEFKSKVGEIIIGYYQRERNGTIFVDLGKVEGIFPRKYQSPRESYHVGDRIKALIVEVEKTKTGFQVVLSRTHAEFVRKLLELEIPEIYDKTIEIFKIVREPGYRTKVAVYTKRTDIDPVGACVGPKGMRSQLISQELEGEKIDFIRYDINPKEFIRNALAPAQIKEVYIVDDARHMALAVVEEHELSIAIGKSGQNVKLANRLCDWNIDVMTEEQYLQDSRNVELKKAADSLFSAEEEQGEELLLKDLPGMKPEWILALESAGIQSIEQFLEAEESEMPQRTSIAAEDLARIREIIEENVEIVQEEAEEEETEAYSCPECGAPITMDMDHCPSCGVALSFEVDEGRDE
ncbi:Transcription termination/antitermination protein NusA [uncultured spirochete]|uniref:Transcription termination/antitermination protein NusA n=1 Tax=uncultured spirochete TaxID=156406 RepID=A0A3P3XF45_9SPIR|nr:transcription termination factor NusA [Rectinema subterraneum]SLM09846.1 Transcription termination/antitermination protein NusA [uncultured spirochete]